MADASSLERIFFEALEKDSLEERAAFLKEACGGDDELRRRVEKMLKAQASGRAFLESPVHRFSSTVDEESESEGPGATIGPYKLLEEIGEGGFGVVFMADQTEPVRRKVALKVLKSGMDTRQVVARFEAERQALAIMDHPNIARVFDGGTTTTGRPFFVMELVKGSPITEFCDQNLLTPRERLALFLSVCRAVQHAHQKGIIHRDLKPSNVLVSRHDSTPVVKVIDFGVAKALGQELTNKTLFTGVAQIIGTPLYMSPEQAGMSDLDVDTRSDIYSLGVLLYELLTGTTPFTKDRFKTAAYDEIWRIIREEEPPKPSTRLSHSKGSLASVSAQRQTDPTSLTKLVRGDLDWIVMKALEKDRNRRYETATSLAADVQRYLDDEPVLARSPTTWYRLQKFVRRNKGPALAASLVVLTLVGGVVGTTWGMLRAETARTLATNETNEKRKALDEKGVALDKVNDQLFRALVNRARAERSSGRIGQRFAALKTIREAAKFRITDELKAEAAAALVLPDFEIAHEWEAFSEDTVDLDFDANFERYARLDSKGGVAVCRRSNDREEILARLPPCGRPPYSIPVMSPDGRYVAFRNYQEPGNFFLGSTYVLSISNRATTGAPLTLPGGWYEGAVAYRSNSRQLAIGYVDGWVGVYDLNSGERIKRLEIGAKPFHLAFHPTDGRIAVAVPGAVRIFDVDSGKESPPFRVEAGFANVCWHPDGRRIALSGTDSKIHLWDTVSACASTLVSGDYGFGNRVAFNPSGTLLVCRSWDHISRIRDGRTGRLLIEAPDLGLRFSQDGRLLGCTKEGKIARLWRIADGAELRSLRERNSNESDGLRKAVLHQNGRVLAATGGKRLGFFDVVSGEELASIELAHSDTAHPVFFDPPSGISKGKPDWKSKLSEAEKASGWVTGGADGMFCWPAVLVPDRPSLLRIGPARFVLEDAAAGLYSGGTSAGSDGRVMAVPQGSSTLLVHRDQPEKRMVLTPPQHDVRFSAVSPDGRWVFTGSHFHDDRSKAAQIWDAETGAHVRDLALVASCPGRFSPDGKWLIANSSNGARLFEAETWRELRRLTGYGTFSPDSRMLASQEGVNGILIEETATGRMIARLTSPRLFRNCPESFTPDGARLILVDGDIWDLRLIRKQLKELDLDWEWPEFPPPNGSESLGPIQVEILKGEFEKPRSSHLARERKTIERYRRRVAANPNDVNACNGLAWCYLTGAESLRDAKAALPLAEKAVNSDRGNGMLANTLGVAYYRNARYRDSINTLRTNLSRSKDKHLAHDLYFLAMSHHQLGETERARDFFDWAERSPRTGLSESEIDELRAFQAEAKSLLGDRIKKSVEASPPPPAKK